mgnify:CR=1 FL=1
MIQICYNESVGKGIRMSKKLTRDTKNQKLAGVCAGLGNYFNIQANIVRLVTVLLFLSSTEIGIITVTLYAYLASWLGNEPLGDGAKKARNQAIILLAVCLILVSLGTEGLTAIYESGKAFGQWLVGLV